MSEIIAELVFGDRVLLCSLLNADIKGMCHSTQPELFLYFIRKPLKQSISTKLSSSPAKLEVAHVKHLCVSPAHGSLPPHHHCSLASYIPTPFLKPSVLCAWSHCFYSSGHIINASSITKVCRFFFLLKVLFFLKLSTHYTLQAQVSSKDHNIFQHHSNTSFTLPQCLSKHGNTHSPKRLTQATKMEVEEILQSDGFQGSCWQWW